MSSHDIHELTRHHMCSHDITWTHMSSHDIPHYCSPTSGYHQGSGSWGSVYAPLYVTRTHRDTNLLQTATHPSRYSQIPKREKQKKHSTLQYPKLTGACSLKYLINIPTWCFVTPFVGHLMLTWHANLTQLWYSIETADLERSEGTLRLTRALAYLVSCLAMTAEETNFPPFTMAHSIQTQVTSCHTKLRRKGPCTVLVHKCCYNMGCGDIMTAYSQFNIVQPCLSHRSSMP